jgi:UDP-3-O-[3-hydroxymyristoyl] glucosamine N-acyltransferase
VSGDVSFNSRLIVSSDVSLNSRLFVSGDVSFNSRLIVLSDVSLNSRLFVGGDVSFNSRLIVLSDVSLNSRLFVGGDVSINQRLLVLGDVSMSGNVFIVKSTVHHGDTSFNQRLFVGGDVSINQRLLVLGDSSFNGNLVIYKNVLIQGNVTVGGAQIIQGQPTTTVLYSTMGTGPAILPINYSINNVVYYVNNVTSGNFTVNFTNIPSNPSPITTPFSATIVILPNTPGANNGWGFGNAIIGTNAPASLYFNGGIFNINVSGTSANLIVQSISLVYNTGTSKYYATSNVTIYS